MDSREIDDIVKEIVKGVVGPKLEKAVEEFRQKMVLKVRVQIKRLTSEDGLVSMHDFVKVGDEYDIYPLTVSHQKMKNIATGKVIERSMVFADSTVSSVTSGWLPLEFFDLEEIAQRTAEQVN
jgi:hypothetical protein